MKATFRIPKTKKGWFVLCLIIINVLIGSWPVIPLLNTEAIVLGLPMLIFWAYLIIITTTLILWLSTKMGVH